MPVKINLDELDDGDLLLPREIALIFRVDPKTITRWSNAGRLPSVRTLGGHRRFRAGDVKALLNGGGRDLQDV